MIWIDTKQSDWRHDWKRPEYTYPRMFKVMAIVFTARGGFRSVVTEVAERVYLDRKMGSGLSAPVVGWG